MIRYLCADCRTEKHLGYACPACRKVTNIIIDNTGGITNPQVMSGYELVDNALPDVSVLDRIVERIMDWSLSLNPNNDYVNGVCDGIGRALQIIVEERERSGS